MADSAPDQSDRRSVILDVADGVATITLNRPDAMNSLDVATKELLLETVTQVAADDAVRCVVLTGTGRAFCTGQDLKEHIELLENGGSDQLFTTVEQHYNPIVTALVEMEKPVVAKVNGVAAGAGASLAFACDLRIVADTGASYHLPMLVGRAKAMELLYFPRTVKADEALELGLATAVVPADALDAEVDALAGRLAAGPTVALGSMRQAVNHAAAGASFAEALAFEGERMTRTGATADHRAAVAAFVAKEKPVFEGR